MSDKIIKLSERLLMVSKMVRQGSVVADIGTDHAYLPVYLIQKGICPQAIVADLREMPLENARDTVNENCLHDKIKLILSDGLDSISENTADDITIAGMGGDLISNILSRVDWIKNKNVRIIAQPQTHSEKVREFFINNGFEIVYEDACVDDNRNYICMCAEYTGKKIEYEFGYEYFGELVKCNNEYAKEYLVHQRNRFSKRAIGLEQSGQNTDEARALLKLIKKFDEILEEK